MTDLGRELHLTRDPADRIHRGLPGAGAIDSQAPMRKDEEVLVATGDSELVYDLLSDFGMDLGRSNALHLDRLRKRPWWRRVVVAALLEPLRSEI